MDTVNLEQKDDISIIRMKKGLTNPVGPDLVKDMHAALDQIPENNRGMVLCGGEKFFSIGLDLPQLLTFERKEMKRFWYDFNDLIFRLFSLPVPTACAIEGHAPGAGAILALTCDFRFISKEKALVGFNEIQLNIAAPYLAAVMLRQAVSQPDADELLFEGGLIPAAKSKEINFVTDILPKGEVKNQAVQKVQRIAAFSGKAFADTKAIKTERIKELFEKNHALQHELFLDNWFSGSGQAALKEALKKF